LRKQVLDSDKGWAGSRTGAEMVDGEERQTPAPSGSGWTLPLQLTIDVGNGASEGAGEPRIKVNGRETPAEGDQVEGTGSAAQDQLVSAWKAHEGALRGAEPPEGSPPWRAESPFEWLSRQSGGASEAQDQFAQEGALW
jgi:hypothetical protein